MKILALETSTEVGSCALWLDGSVQERVCPPGRPHSETLLPLVRSLLAEAGLSFSQLSAVAFGVGPGAFTGLRVACGAAQGIAVAADLPLVPVVSLEAMADAAGADHVFSLLDARMGEVYYGAYQRREEGFDLLGEIRLSTPEGIDFPTGSQWIACGNGLAAYPRLAQRASAMGIACLPSILPMASPVARLGAVRFAAGEVLDPADAAPLYVRDKVAKTVAERLSEGGKA